MSRVYVIQENRKIDISPAEEHGEVKVLLPSGDANYQVDETYQTLCKGLENFNPEQDHVLLTGDPTAIFMAGAVLADLMFEREQGRHVKVLKWNRRTSRYLSLTTPLQGDNHG
jgi:hypothetical protein